MRNNFKWWLLSSIWSKCLNHICVDGKSMFIPWEWKLPFPMYGHDPVASPRERYSCSLSLKKPRFLGFIENVYGFLENAPLSRFTGRAVNIGHLHANHFCVTRWLEFSNSIARVQYLFQIQTYLKGDIKSRGLLIGSMVWIFQEAWQPLLNLC